MSKMLDLANSSAKIKRAYEIAKDAHSGQVDKAGAEYIWHPVTVASEVATEAEEDLKESAVIAALLHDVCEDTSVTLDMLAEEFEEEIINAIAILTHKREEPYMEYIARVKTNPVARTVKCADLKHNMDLSRFSQISQADIDRLENKYKPAMKLLLKK